MHKKEKQRKMCAVGTEIFETDYRQDTFISPKSAFVK